QAEEELIDVETTAALTATPAPALPELAAPTLRRSGLRHLMMRRIWRTDGDGDSFELHRHKDGFVAVSASRVEGWTADGSKLSSVACAGARFANRGDFGCFITY